MFFHIVWSHSSLPSPERKLRPNEQPHALYIQNYSTATSSCLCVRRWLFSAATERRLCAADPLALSFFYWEAVQAVNRGHLTVGERLYELKALQEQTKKQEVGLVWVDGVLSGMRWRDVGAHAVV